MSLVLIIIAAIAVGVSFINLNRSQQNMNRANEKAKNACIDLRDFQLYHLIAGRLGIALVSLAPEAGNAGVKLN